MKLKKIYKLLLIAFIISFVSITTHNFYTKENIQESTSETTNNKEKKNDVVYPIKNKLSLLATGDALYHDALLADGLKSDGSYDFSHHFTEIKDIVSNYDLAFYNQETVFGGNDFKYVGYPNFNTPSILGKNLINTGFNLVSLANNHSMDKGIKGALNSAKWWEEKENVYSSGMSSSFENRNNFKIQEINGIKYGFIAYTSLTNIKVPDEHKYILNTYSNEQAKKDIESLKEKADLIIVSMHWGNEYQHTPSQHQKNQAHYLSSLGVNLILGNHAHALQPIEFINDALVIYAMGNLISNQMAPVVSNTHGLKGTIGAFVMMDIVKSTEKDEFTEISFENIEVLLHFSSKLYNSKTNKHEYKVVPFTKIDESNLPSYMKNFNGANYKQIFNQYKKIMEHERVNIINPF